MKVIVTMGTQYCGCPSEEVEFEYYGTQDEFDMDDQISTDILNKIFNGEFPHYYLDIECINDENEEDEYE